MNNRAAPTRQSATSLPAAEDIPDLMPIGAVAEATGLSVETLRIWERRYGRPKPIRRPSGHRRYPREEVLRLQQIAALVARGHRPSQVVALENEELVRMNRVEGAETPQSRETDAEIDQLIEAVCRYDGEVLVRWLHENFKRDNPLPFLEDRVAPLAREIGRRWAAGELAIRHEHYATGLMEDFISSRRPLYLPDPSRPRALFATLSGERHSLGIEMASLVAAAGAVPLRMVGADTPRVQIAAAAHEWRANIVAVGMSDATAGPETDRELAQLREELAPHVALVIGGGARGNRRGPRGVEFCRTLPAWRDWLVNYLRSWG